MKKINTIDYGGRVIGMGLIFLCVLPALLYGLHVVFAFPMIYPLMWGSIGVGAAIEICFGCILALELRQDRIIDQYYTDHPSSQKTPQQILDAHRWHRKHESR